MCSISLSISTPTESSEALKQVADLLGFRPTQPTWKRPHGRSQTRRPLGYAPEAATGPRSRDVTMQIDNADIE